METLVVVPVHPTECCEFEVVNCLPWPSSWASREFGLVESVDGFCEGIIERISDAANGRSGSDLVQPLGVTNTRKLRPCAECRRRSSNLVPRCLLATLTEISTRLMQHSVRGIDDGARVRLRRTHDEIQAILRHLEDLGAQRVVANAKTAFK